MNRDYMDFDEPESTYGFCDNCEVNVRAKRMDFGIGCYEYWGSKEVHTDWREVCPKCESELLPERAEDEGIEE
jgi:hypothetical protein